jgi:RNA polymerase sigma factor (sigma-70 family)
MTTTATDWSPEMYAYLEGIATSVGRSVRRRFPMVELEDLQQEALMWAVAHPKRLQGYLDDPNEEKCTLEIERGMENAARAYARKARAATRIGGDNRDPLTDDVWYTTASLKGDRHRQGLLHSVFDDQAWFQPETSGEQIRSTPSDPAEGGNWLATLADVGSAIESLTPEDRGLLELHYRDGLTYDAIGAMRGASRMHVSRLIDRAVRKVQDALGGPCPRTEPPEDGWENGLVGTRRALSNAASRVLTENPDQFHPPGPRR